MRTLEVERLADLRRRLWLELELQTPDPKNPDFKPDSYVITTLIDKALKISQYEIVRLQIYFLARTSAASTFWLFVPALLVTSRMTA
jgi:hypothetical protein